MEVIETPVVTVMKEILKPDKIIETHISQVFIKDDFVYKVKKNVDFGFLDFSSKKKRKVMCIVEKELNERFCKGIYLDVLKIARKEKTFELVPFDSSLITLDYCVKMKRIPEESFLAHKIKEGEVDASDAAEIGRKIAELFKGIVTDPEAAELNGGADIVRQNCIENFDQIRPFCGRFITEEALEFVQKQTVKFLDSNMDLLNKRVKDGFVVDGHGDLRLEHIYMEGDTFGLIDCIEFNKRFRFNDVMSEMGFLCTESDQMGDTAFADGLMDGFLSVYDDEGSANLINFYKAYRAMVRAKVACFLLADKDESFEFYEDKRAEIAKYMEMAVIYSLNMFETKAVIFYGLMASGKTKNARTFAEAYPVEHVNTDVVRKLMHGIDPDAKVHVDFGAELYSAENSAKLYEYMGDMVESNKALGRMTLIDGSFTKICYIDQLCSKYTGKFTKVRFHAPEDVVMDRLQKRLEAVTASDGRPEIYEAQKASAEDIGSDFEVETTGEPEDNVKAIIGYLIDKA
ncbi:gluconate kinase [Denitrovibrio acetiphilus DSM 12809]|uniref:Gluconate kinase n=1 Tax=Denitrovibrio acetiphilus (strain DSM 12809 / NBRC 114555 / N2460) TaxID=522772 RepID=D4H8E0_DENA2|nr:bifunctional aminoglycoside phosphotransferase/ATP-binding protein [Denitrovibrio acetiphilus]ADD68289.1 gluconate kinase [Denitrovibrio acetiphilus DSM 12809]